MFTIVWWLNECFCSITACAAHPADCLLWHCSTFSLTHLAYWTCIDSFYRVTAKKPVAVMHWPDDVRFTIDGTMSYLHMTAICDMVLILYFFCSVQQAVPHSLGHHPQHLHLLGRPCQSLAPHACLSYICQTDWRSLHCQRGLSDPIGDCCSYADGVGSSRLPCDSATARASRPVHGQDEERVAGMPQKGGKAQLLFSMGQHWVPAA